jgi:hypothetical protein
MADYELGTTKRFKVEWRDIDTDVLIDPTTMGYFKIYDTDMNVKFTDLTPSKEATGIYFVDVALNGTNEFQVGHYMYEWTCTYSSFPIMVRGVFGIQHTRAT